MAAAPETDRKSRTSAATESDRKSPFKDGRLLALPYLLYFLLGETLHQMRPTAFDQAGHLRLQLEPPGRVGIAAYSASGSLRG